MSSDYKTAESVVTQNRFKLTLVFTAVTLGILISVLASKTHAQEIDFFYMEDRHFRINESERLYSRFLYNPDQLNELTIKYINNESSDFHNYFSNRPGSPADLDLSSSNITGDNTFWINCSIGCGIVPADDKVSLLLAQVQRQSPSLFSLEDGTLQYLEEFPLIRPDQSIQDYLEENRSRLIEESPIERMSHFDSFSAVTTAAGNGYVVVRDVRTNVLRILKLPMRLFCKIFPWLWDEN